MTTSHSPLRVLKAQADAIAKIIKAVGRGETPKEDVGGRITAARGREAVKFGVMMDDKFISIEITWTKIREASEVSLAEMILREMRGRRETTH